MLRFSDVLGAMPVATFLNDVMGTHHHLAHGARERFAALMSWRELAEVLVTHRLDYPRLRLVRQGATVAPQEYLQEEVARRGERFRRPSAAKIEALMRSGAMLHLAAADELSIALSALAASVEEAVGSNCFINLHAGLHNSRGFDTHWDGHEVCVLQVSGRKHWRVLGITEQAPLAVPPDQKGPPPEKVVWEGVLEEGDVLYMPRGCWHAAEARDGPSLHLSLGWENPTAGDFMAWLVARQRRELAFRQDAPVSSQGGLIPPFIKQLHATMGLLDLDEAYGAYLDQRRSEARRKRQTMSLP